MHSGAKYFELSGLLELAGLSKLTGLLGITGVSGLSELSGGSGHTEVSKLSDPSGGPDLDSEVAAGDCGMVLSLRCLRLALQLVIIFLLATVGPSFFRPANESSRVIVSSPTCCCQ